MMALLGLLLPEVLPQLDPSNAAGNTCGLSGEVGCEIFPLLSLRQKHCFAHLYVGRAFCNTSCCVFVENTCDTLLSEKTAAAVVVIVVAVVVILNLES